MGAEQVAAYAARIALDAAELAARTVQTAGQLALHLAGPVRAILHNLDDAGKDFAFPFNPESFSLQRGGGLMREGEQSGNFAGLRAGPGQNDTLSFDIWLDASDIGSKVAYAASAVSPVTSSIAGTTGSVLEDMQTLYDLTKKKVESGQTEGRLPVLAFLWHDFRFTGVITALGFDVKLFDALGAPRRAKVSITMMGQAFENVNAAQVLRTELNATESMDEFSAMGLSTAKAASTLKATALRVALRLI
jgi:hypothetical protein